MKAISMGVSAVRSGVTEKSRFALGAVLWSKHPNAILRQDYRTVQKSEPECLISGGAQLPEETPNVRVRRKSHIRFVP